MNIFKVLNLPERKRAADLDKALAELVKERDDLEARRAEVKTALGPAPFEYPDRMPELRATLRQLDEDLDILAGTITETERRAQVAKQAEDDERIRARLAEGRKARDKLREEAVLFHKGIDDLVRVVERLEGHSRDVRAANAAAGLDGHGLIDWKNPWTEHTVRAPNFTNLGLTERLLDLKKRVDVDSMDQLAARPLVREAAE